MNLENFPMDTQRCPLQFGSCKFTNEKPKLKGKISENNFKHL